MRRFALLLSLLLSYAAATNIVITNDDGWATAQIRQQFDTLTSAGHNVVLSSPALDQSGKGSSTSTPEPLTEPCEFNTCPTGSPAEGFNTTNPRLNYVNGFPVDAARFGIRTLAPKFFSGAAPDLVVSGPNIGNNLGLVVLLSGTVGAASDSALSGVPAVAFSGASGSQVSYTTLTSTPDAASSVAARTYAALTATFVKTLVSAAGGAPLLPTGVIVNVNYAAVDKCTSPAAFKWVFSRLVENVLEVDVETCGSSHLPSESRVVGAGCFASVTVLDASSKLDVNATLQVQVLERLGGLPLTCLPN
ncbi:sure-like protein [Lenzites betulinus]|nr:sure-like protein [Lenzites betulinus]